MTVPHRDRRTRNLEAHLAAEAAAGIKILFAHALCPSVVMFCLIAQNRMARDPILSRQSVRVKSVYESSASAQSPMEVAA